MSSTFAQTSNQFSSISNTSSIHAVQFVNQPFDIHIARLVRRAKGKRRNKRRGFTFDNCTWRRKCNGNRICADFAMSSLYVFLPENWEFDLCPKGVSCLCLPPRGLQMCKWDGDCNRNEFCAFLFPRVCLSRRLLARGERGYHEKKKLPSAPSQVNGSIATGGRCNSTEECKMNRRCLGAWDREQLRTDDCSRAKTSFGDFARCMCVPDNPQRCHNTTSCEVGEDCYSFGGAQLCSSHPYPFPV